MENKYCKDCKFRNAEKVCEIKKIYIARKNSCEDFKTKKGKK
jgi:hypothetical protein